MIASGQRSGRPHGLLFDTAVFLGNWLTVGVALAALPDVWAGALLVTAVLAQAAGAWLKTPYLRRRLGPAPQGWATRFMQALLLLHFILFTVMILLGAALLGWYTPNGRGETWWVLLGFIGGGATTWLVWRAAQPARADEQKRFPAAPLLEYGADALLWLSVLIATRAFWDLLQQDLGTGYGAGFTPQGITLLLALSFLFVVFYLPARYLFFVEDYWLPATWGRVWLAMLPLATAVLTG